jgi:malate dehydrogenase (oxaloacetate-decarboxylating)
LKIPVFHDDQHGSAIVVLAALLNALRVVDKKPEDVRVVISGAGAAGVATAALLRENGIRDIAAFDSHGAVHPDRDDLTGPKRRLAEQTSPPRPDCSLTEGLRDADVFVGLSAPGLLEEEDIAAMADQAIVFALA